jgi:hypothetical protein
MVQRPSPSLALKSQRFLPILQKIGGPDGKATPDEQMAGILGLPDDELERLTVYAEIVLADAVAEPRLYVQPKTGQLSPNDVPINDFWELFIYISQGCPQIPVKTKDGETSIDAVASFPGEQGPNTGISTNSESIQ